MINPKMSLAELKKQETILIFAKGKVGKTWAYCSIIEKCLQAGKQVFLINSDNGVKHTMQEYFGNKFDEYAKKINYYLVTHIDQMDMVIPDIKEKVTPDDLIVLDLFSDFWNQAQDKFIENLSGGNVMDYMERASRDKTKFGMLSGQQWQYTKKLNSRIVNEIVIKCPCKVVGVAGANDLEMDIIHKNQDVLDRYGLLGQKPTGSKETELWFDTLIYIGEVKQQKHFIILGSRGNPTNQERIKYGRNFWEAVTTHRARKNE